MAKRSFYKQNTMPDLLAGESEPPLPTFIGPYKIESLLNKGGMAFLYLGIDLETKKPLAIKVLSPSYVNHPETIQRFLREAKVIALTNHPNIVKLYGQGEWEKGLYIAMELIHGISLKQFILQHSLSMRRALEITLQVAFALLHLHSHGVIHRDLKPENILITEEGEIKVIDFGIAQVHEEKTTDSSRFLGTPNYMSPEQKENPSSVTFASDIYSLGVILYELILGKLSFGIINLTALPKGLKKIAVKTLAVSPEERYQNISEFIHDVSQYLNSGDLEKERPGSDQAKELNEKIQKANLDLSPLALPNWPQIEVGVSKGRGRGQLGLYYDFFRLPNNTFLILIASATSHRIRSAVSIAVLRGMIKMLLSDYITNPKSVFKPIPFVEKLNRLAFEDIIGEKFAINFVLLDPLRDQATYVSCGLGDLLHLPQGQNIPRRLSSPNELLGASQSTIFSETTDNWNAGDTLILHSLAPYQGPDPQLDGAINEAVSENLLLSAQRQAEAILKKIPSATPYPKALITIQRII
ncbi:MAG: protein kinase [Candidatus Melainabacteria bacterium]|nr:protein kinase [Candidatus Melainabacteria bacterium]